MPTPLRIGRALRFAARQLASRVQAAGWPADMPTVAHHLLAEYIGADPSHGHPQLWQRRADSWYAFTDSDQHDQAEKFTSRRLDPLRLIGDVPEAVGQLAAVLWEQPDAGPDVWHRRIQAWSVFAHPQDQVAALSEAAHRVDPPRVPIGWLTINPRRHNPFAKADQIMVCSSGGKDSLVMKHLVCTAAEAAGALDKVVVVHNDLGVTDSGEPVEWPGTEDLVHRQAARYGVPVIITRREQGGLFQQLTEERAKFPSAQARWCTSDQKEGPGKKEITKFVSRRRVERPGEHVIVYYALGLRGAESRGRAGKPEFVIDRAASNSRRTVIRWHPIIGLTDRQVWETIRDHALEYHWAYDLRMDRLSCRLCVLATEGDLVRSAQLNPQIVVDYIGAEVSTEHTFKYGLAMADVQAKAGPVARGRRAKRRRIWYRRMRPGAAIRRHLDEPAEQHGPHGQLLLFAA
ncbi:phosphoadenosine phosphosulfate reductase family protein [Kitasatospora sp. RB6PN24]|uniref:phosphoadenosine phosphosulfate reductase domain-containing protein n=1 Tax=Kitasatospora humi TaxID=2893891 RepID=UPI001E5441DF|nr:phosphoadenosine phosphosulfate reductase family protein [Kitasatospora humi]MCC9309910.1 phosphoadenosine phosphosulfate reductase family protein [Kitasatospora humi]